MPRTGPRLFGQELTQQAVGILIASTLPRRVGICEPDVHVQSVHQLGVARHLATAVVGHARPHRSRKLLQLAAEAFQRSVCCAAIHLAQDHETGLSLDQRSNTRAVERTLDQIALPMPRYQSLSHFLRAMDNTKLLGHPGALGSCCAPAPTRWLALAQRLYQFLLQPASGMGVDAAYMVSWLTRWAGSSGCIKRSLTAICWGDQRYKHKAVMNALEQRASLNDLAPAHTIPAALPVALSCKRSKVRNAR